MVNPYQQAYDLSKWHWIWKTNKGPMITGIIAILILGLAAPLYGYGFMGSLPGYITGVVMSVAFYAYGVSLYNKNRRSYDRWQETYGSLNNNGNSST